MDSNKLFSREALEKLHSPEQLDSLLPITTPINWMALVAVAVLIFSVILWSLFGAFTVKVDGMGMVVDAAGTASISHISNGKIADVYVHNGDHVKKGDLIAHVQQPVQAADTRMTKYNMNLAQNDRDAMNRVAEHDAKAYQEMVNEDVYSDYDGIVDDVMIERGSLITTGTPLITIRRTQNRKDLTGILYVPLNQGKRIKPGMSIQLSPNGVDTSQSGWLVGVVHSVSEYPVTSVSMQKALNNDQLVQMILKNSQNAVMEVRFDLVEDPESESGYLWTSFVGTHKPVTPGSFCTGSIIIERIPPIQKVFYKFSQWIRNR